MKIKLPKLPLILIVLGLVVLLGAIALVFFRPGPGGGPGQPQGWGQRPGGAQDFGGPPTQRARWSGPVPTPPQNKITYYKGLWGAWFYPEEYTGLKLEPEKYVPWGVNIVMIQPGFEINKRGQVRYPPDFPTYEDLDARIGELATKFYEANIHVGLTPGLTYKEEFSSGQKGELWAGEPQPFPKEIVEKPGYLDEYNQVVEDMAKIAEKYHVEMYSPMGEPDGIFGMNVAPAWTQKVVPLIRKHYTGKLYYKGDLHSGQGDRMNFKGYDVLGFVTNPVSFDAPMEETRKSYDADMERALAWAKRDGVPEVVMSEYGYLGDNKMESAARIGLVLEEGSKKLNGIFLSEPIPAVFETNQGNQIVREIKKWF
jgi:hypothetical protein